MSNISRITGTYIDTNIRSRNVRFFVKNINDHIQSFHYYGVTVHTPRVRPLPGQGSWVADC